MRKALLLAVAALALAASQAGAQEKKQLVIVVKGLDNPFFEAINQGCQKWNKENASSEYECFYTGPASTSDEAGEAQIVADMLAKPTTAAIAISPSNAPLIAQTIRNANPQIPVMTLDADLTKEDASLRKTYLGTDNYTMGFRLGEYFKQHKPDGGKVCTIQGNPAADNILQRAQGFRDAVSGQKGLAALAGAIEKAFEISGTSGLSGNPAVQAHIHHLWLGPPLLAQEVASPGQVCAEILCLQPEAVNVAPVIVVERVGHHELRLAIVADPVWKIIRKGIRIVGETADFGQDTPGVYAHPARIPALRPLARGFRVDADRLEVTADAARLDVDDGRCPEGDGVGGRLGRHDRLVEAHRRRHLAGEHGVLADPTPWGLRFVWHLDRTDEDVEAAAAVVRKVAAD